MQIAVTPDQYATYHPEGIAAREAAEAGDFTFLDLVDVVNPLQHVPLVSTVYREITGDTIKGPAMIVGGFLYGGVSGFGAGIINAVALEATGGTIADHILDAVFGGDRVRQVPRQDLYAVFGDPEPAPETADLLATAQRAPTPEELRARTAEIAAIARGYSDPGAGPAPPTHAELDARTAQVAAVARQLAAADDAAPAIPTTMASADVMPPPVPPPPGRPAEPDRRYRDIPPEDPLVATVAPHAPESPGGSGTAVTETADSPAVMPALALTLPELASGTAMALSAEAAPMAGTPPPPEAFMALPARVPATNSRMTLATSTGFRPTPSAQPTSSWMAQEIAASVAAPPTQGLAGAAPQTDEDAQHRADDPASADEAEPVPGQAGPLPGAAIPAAMMRNLDAYQTLARSAG